MGTMGTIQGSFGMLHYLYIWLFCDLFVAFNAFKLAVPCWKWIAHTWAGNTILMFHIRIISIPQYNDVFYLTSYNRPWETGDRSYIFDPVGIVTDEHGGNRSRTEKMLKDDMVSRAKSCESHFYDCAHRVAKSDWSPKSKAEFLTLVHEIYCSETPSAYEAKRRTLMDWASKDKRSHVKAWFNQFWHVRRYVHLFIALRWVRR